MYVMAVRLYTVFCLMYLANLLVRIGYKQNVRHITVQNYELIFLTLETDLIFC